MTGLSQLNKVFISSCDSVKDLSVFRDMAELRELYIRYVEDSDLVYLQKLTKLEKLDIIGGNIKNYRGLENLENIKELSLFENGRVFDEKSQSFDLVFLKKMKNLENLCIAHVNIENLKFLSQVENLEIITLVDTQVSNIDSLTNLENLKILNVFGNTSEQVEARAEKYFMEVETLVSEDIPYPY